MSKVGWYDGGMLQRYFRRLDIIVAVLLPVVVFALDWATRGRQAPLYIAPSWDAPLPLFTIVALLPFIWLLLASGVLAYAFLRRKIAIVGAAATSLFAQGLLILAPIAAHRIGSVASLTLAGVAASLTFCLLYGFLVRTRRPKIMSIVAISAGFVFVMGASVVSFYFMRLSFYL